MGKFDHIENAECDEDSAVIAFPPGAFGGDRVKKDTHDPEVEVKHISASELFHLEFPLDKKYNNKRSFFEPWFVFLISDFSSGFRSHVEWLSSLVPNVELNSNPCEAFQLISALKPYSSIAVVDIDMFGDLGIAVEDLSTFRREAPMVPVVIGSRDFKCNDFSSERSMIADSSMVLPASKEDFGMAIGAAINNHKARMQKLLIQRCG